MRDRLIEIKEMARDIFEPNVAIDGIDLAFASVHGADDIDTHFMRIANHLYQKGYRKIVQCKDCDIPHNKWTGCPKLNGLVPPPDFYCSLGCSKKEEAEAKLKEGKG